MLWDGFYTTDNWTSPTAYYVWKDRSVQAQHTYSTCTALSSPSLRADITNPSQHTPQGQTCLRFLFNGKSRQSPHAEQSEIKQMSLEI